MHRIFIRLFSLAAAGLLLFSCNSEKPEPVPTQLFDDPQGVKLHLTWTAEGNLTAPADLDLFLAKGTDESNLFLLEASRSMTGSEETVLFPVRLFDGSYVVYVNYYAAGVRVNYKVDVTGVSTGTTQSFTGRFEAGNENTHANVIRIWKEGTTFRAQPYAIHPL